MSGATILAPIVVENVHNKDGVPKSLEMDAQLWLAPGYVVSARLQYYNKFENTFNKIEAVLAVINVRLILSSPFLSSHNRPQVASAVSLSKQISNEDIISSQTSSSSSSSSPLDDFDFCGDVVLVSSKTFHSFNAPLTLSFSCFAFQ
jgi:hypothetical protein